MVAKSKRTKLQASKPETERIHLDFNRIDWPTFMEFIRRNDELKESELTLLEKTLAQRELSGELIELVLVDWDFDAPKTKDGYLKLGLLDAQRVDRALAREIEKVNLKN